MEAKMALAKTVKVSRRYQIAVPAIARSLLNIQSGDLLTVDIQDGMLILLPKPENYTQALAGLHKEIWQGIDAGDYIDKERREWNS
jgi:AbrB family looped-hinge helix DNA binding protein